HLLVAQAGEGTLRRRHLVAADGGRVHGGVLIQEQVASVHVILPCWRLCPPPPGLSSLATSLPPPRAGPAARAVRETCRRTRWGRSAAPSRRAPRGFSAAGHDRCPAAARSGCAACWRRCRSGAGAADRRDPE